jgi:hypothetical protein
MSDDQALMKRALSNAYLMETLYATCISLILHFIPYIFSLVYWLGAEFSECHNQVCDGKPLEDSWDA